MSRVIIFCLLGLSMSLQAKVGIRAGYLHTDLHNAEAEAKSGYTIGLNFSLKRFHVEVNYCTKGAIIKNAHVYTQDRDVYSYTIDVSTGYLEVPFLYDIFRFQMENSKLTCYFGFAFSLGVADNSFNLLGT